MKQSNISTKNNWYVITGGPCTGKTTAINLLTKRGYKTTIEHARHYIDTMRSKGKTTDEIRNNNRKFQLGVLKMQIEQEATINPKDIVFLDRAIPDVMAYYRFLKLKIDRTIINAMSTVNYRKIFILDRLPLINDYARTENKMDQILIHNLITKVYKTLPFPVIKVPVLKPEERVNYILKNIKKS
jgi:predicted ATPase